MKAYALQLTVDPFGVEVVRTSDGVVVKPVPELERLAAENEKLRAGRDDKVLEARREVERLRAQVKLLLSEKDGQLRLP